MLQFRLSTLIHASGFMVLAAFSTFGGTGASKPQGYSKLSAGSFLSEDYGRKIYSNIPAVVVDRDAIWSESKVSRKTRQLATEAIFERALHLLKSADDFLYMLQNAPDKKPVDLFLQKNLDKFFAISPTIEQVLALEKVCDQIPLALQIKNDGLKLVRITKDYFKLVQNSQKSEVYLLGLANMIRESLFIFKETQPIIDEVMELHKHILDIQVEIAPTVHALIKLKDTFIKSFTGADLIRLLEYGCNPAEYYRKQLKDLKIMHEIKF